MTTKTWQRIFSFIVLAGLLLKLTNPGAAQAQNPVTNPTAPAVPKETLSKIETKVFDEIAAKGQTDFFVTLKEQADLSAAAKHKPKYKRGITSSTPCASQRIAPRKGYVPIWTNKASVHPLLYFEYGPGERWVARPADGDCSASDVASVSANYKSQIRNRCSSRLARRRRLPSSRTCPS